MVKRGLIEDTLQYIYTVRRKLQGDKTPEYREKMFDHKVQWGQLSVSVSYIAEKGRGNIF